MIKILIQSVSIITVGLVLLSARVFAEKPQICSSRKSHVAKMGRFGDYSTTINSDKKTSIMSYDGKKVVAELIYSPNKKFHAFTDYRKQTTTIYTVVRQGNMGRIKVFWAMKGCFDLLGLSNEGGYLVVGANQTDPLPFDYKKDRLMLSFFKRGKLINQVRLNQIITDFSKLRLTDSGYCWGRFLMLNSMGHYVLETVEDKKLLFDVKTGKRIELEKTTNIAGWQTYRDLTKGYEFQYPPDYFLKDSLNKEGLQTGYVLLKKENTGWLISALSEEITNYPQNIYDPGKMSLDNFAINRAKNMYSADGPGGSMYASDITKKESFTNPHNLQVVEIFLSIEMIEYTDNGEQNIEKEIKGPVYAVSISLPKEPYRILFFKLTGEEDNSPETKETLKKMVDSVRIFK